MARKLILLLVVLTLLVPATALAGGASTACKTKYPIVLAHGMGATATMLFGTVDYWYGIPGALKNEGAKVYVTSVNAMDSTANKAASFKTQFLQVLAASGAAKANIIGHSHGCIYTRTAISNLGLSTKVASHTSIAGPHRGATIADMLASLDSRLLSLGTAVVDFAYALLMGDSGPNAQQNILDLTSSYMNNVFNPNTPNKTGIYYQSWSGKVNYACPALVMQPLWLLQLVTDGDNDGLVSINSAKWGTWRGALSGSFLCPGVDHYAEVGQILGLTPGFDAPGFYVDVVKNLKSRGL